MDKILQAVEITFIGMSVVFIVLALLALILIIQGWFIKRKEKTAAEKEKPILPAGELTEEPARISPANPKMAAAITAAITMFNEERQQKQEN